jgi:hypothetical protein
MEHLSRRAEARRDDAGIRESGEDEARRGEIDARETEPGIPSLFEGNRRGIEGPGGRIGFGQQIALESEKLPGFPGVTGVAHRAVGSGSGVLALSMASRDGDGLALAMLSARAELVPAMGRFPA